MAIANGTCKDEDFRSRFCIVARHRDVKKYFLLFHVLAIVDKFASDDKT